MIRATSAALLLFLLAATGVVLWLGYDAHILLKHLDGVAVRAEGIETKANATLINLDKGTAVWAASAKDQAGAVQDLATDAHGTLSEANKALQGVSAISQHVQGTADAATSLLASGRAAVDGLPPIEGDIQTALAGIPPIEQKAGVALDDVNDFLKAKAIVQIEENVAGMTAHGNAILGDAQKVADKETADWLKPRPWWQAPLAKGGQLIDIGAAIARHTP